MASGHAPGFVHDVEGGGEELVITLTPGGSLAVQLDGPESVWGDAALSLTLTDGRGIDVMMYGGRWKTSLFDSLRQGGECVIPHIPAGSYTLEIRSGQLRAATPAVVKEGESTSAVLSF